MIPKKLLAENLAYIKWMTQLMDFLSFFLKMWLLDTEQPVEKVGVLSEFQAVTSLSHKKLSKQNIKVSTKRRLSL